MQFDIFCKSKFQFFAPFRNKHLTKLILNDIRQQGQNHPPRNHLHTYIIVVIEFNVADVTVDVSFSTIFLFFRNRKFFVFLSQIEYFDRYLLLFFFPSFTNLIFEIIHFSKFYDFLLQIETRLVLLQFKFPFFFANRNLKLFLLYWQIKI